MKTSLYRYFDADGRLLYVGIAINPIKRMQQHATLRALFDRVSRIEIEWFETRRQAAHAERKAIAEESPLQNVMHAEKKPRPISAPPKLPLALVSKLPQFPIREMVKEAREEIADLATLPEFGTVGAVCGALSRAGGGSVFTIMKFQNGRLKNPTVNTIDDVQAAIKKVKQQLAA